ncbi:uncharacterized protein UDID_17749 [Ustilago sp. UG-2017a]|nr:uncharacterized protein UDID_17749 [Ustilago sp. UG-2017a]
MPPSTQAGQTGREERDDDQAAATAGNGREEGWLTQVVRILQLANPALTAEEAIAPQGEAEKIPKDVTSSIAHIKKLNEGNWHTWEPTFIDCLQRVHNAKEILYGEIAPGSEGYNEDLDKALVGLIHACCDNSPDSRIDTYTVRGSDEEAQLGSTLYAKLKKALTLNDTVKRAGLAGPHPYPRLGKRFDEDLKKSTLYRCTAQDCFYTNSVDALKTAKPDCKYDEAYHALAKKQQDGEVTGRIRGAARVATSTEQGSTNQVEQGPRGRRDPHNPSAPPKCYACGGPNHIARNCTNTNNNPAPSRDGPTTNPAQEAMIGGDEQPTSDTWIVDSGATHHMVNDERMLLTSTSKDGQICMAGNERCHGPECSGSRRAPVESMAVVQSPWRPWTPTDSHAKEERAHMRGGPAKKRTKRKEQAPPRGGPSSRSMQMVTTQGLER